LCTLLTAHVTATQPINQKYSPDWWTGSVELNI
jgi:hypothetical protein